MVFDDGLRPGRKPGPLSHRAARSHTSSRRAACRIERRQRCGPRIVLDPARHPERNWPTTQRPRIGFFLEHHRRFPGPHGHRHGEKARTCDRCLSSPEIVHRLVELISNAKHALDRAILDNLGFHSDERTRTRNEDVGALGRPSAIPKTDSLNWSERADARWFDPHGLVEINQGLELRGLRFTRTRPDRGRAWHANRQQFVSQLICIRVCMNTDTHFGERASLDLGEPTPTSRLVPPVSSGTRSYGPGPPAGMKRVYLARRGALRLPEGLFPPASRVGTRRPVTGVKPRIVP